MTVTSKLTRKTWYIFKHGRKWDGPYFSERKADEVCIRARRDGHRLVYVEKL